MSKKVNTFDLMWLVEAAGANEKRLAQLSIMFAAMTMATTLTHSDQDRDILYNVTLAMDAIADKMGMPRSEVMKDFRKRVGS